MANHLNGIDHVLIAVHDLQRAAAAWRRLGFTVTPRGGHAEWGTANHCIMFAEDYLELIGLVGPAVGATAERLRHGLETVGEGIAALALATADGAAAALALRERGLDVDDPQSLSRSLELESGPVRPQFSVLRLPEGAVPGVPGIVCQHLTPELLRRPDWLEHANGAIGITSMTIAIEQPETLRPALETVFGPGSATVTDSVVAVHSGHGLLLFCDPEELAQLHPDPEMDEPPPGPAVVALTVACADTGRAAQVLRDNGIAFSRDGEGTIRVARADATGVFLEFTAR